MKKQNVLDLLCDDYIEKNDIENKNLNSIIKDDKEYKKVLSHIHTFLTNNYKILNLDFKYDIYSKEDLEKYKSIYLLYFCVYGVKELLAITPNFFKYYEKEYGTSFAYDEIIFRYLYGNILDLKKILSKNITDREKSALDNFLNDFIELTKD